MNSATPSSDTFDMGNPLQMNEEMTTMTPRYKYLLILILSFTAKIAVSQSSLQPYELQTSPVIFQDSIQVNNGFCFSPDLNFLYLSRAARTPGSGKRVANIFVRELVNGQYVNEKQVEFSGLYIDYHPIISFDGKFLIFNSTRPMPGDSLENAVTHLWYCEWENGEWGSPQWAPINKRGYHTSYASLSSSGKLYFNSNRPGGKGEMDIYVCWFKDGWFSRPAPFTIVNSEHSENDLAISHDESFAIFNRYINSTQSLELLIATKKDQRWSLPEALVLLNTERWELNPYISPDGKFFFYELDGLMYIIPVNALIDR